MIPDWCPFLAQGLSLGSDLSRVRSPPSRARQAQQRLHAYQRQAPPGELIQHPPPVPGRLARRQRGAPVMAYHMGSGRLELGQDRHDIPGQVQERARLFQDRVERL